VCIDGGGGGSYERGDGSPSTPNVEGVAGASAGFSFDFFVFDGPHSSIVWSSGYSRPRTGRSGSAP
jgi:hypothetical protein